MGSAARFTALLVAGVAIVVLYVRSGDSPVVLVLSLLTLLVGLYLWDARPWELDDAEPDRPDDDPDPRS